MASKKINGQQWLADKLGVTQPRVVALVNDPDWPFGKGPWKQSDLPKIRGHMSARRAMANATSATAEDDEPSLGDYAKTPERKAKLELIIERTAKIRLERELLAGGYLKKEQVEADRAARVYAVRAKLQELPLRAALIANKSETECAAIVGDWMKEVCDYFADGK